MDWSVKITKTLNGYYVEPSEDTDDRNFVIQVPETGQETRDEQVALANLFYELRDFFGVYNDKHANDGEGQYLRIEVDNYE